MSPFIHETIDRMSKHHARNPCTLVSSKIIFLISLNNNFVRSCCSLLSIGIVSLSCVWGRWFHSRSCLICLTENQSLQIWLWLLLDFYFAHRTQFRGNDVWLSTTWKFEVSVAIHISILWWIFIIFSFSFVLDVRSCFTFVEMNFNCIMNFSPVEKRTLSKHTRLFCPSVLSGFVVESHNDFTLKIDVFRYPLPSPWSFL